MWCDNSKRDVIIHRKISQQSDVIVHRQTYSQYDVIVYTQRSRHNTMWLFTHREVATIWCDCLHTEKSPQYDVIVYRHISSQCDVIIYKIYVSTIWCVILMQEGFKVSFMLCNIYAFKVIYICVF